jgi:hypothetical protein
MCHVEIDKPPIASLSVMLPRNLLYNLWREHTHGIGGRKAACNFSYHDKGCVKHKNQRWHVVWKIVDRLVKLGYSAETVIDHIHAIYGEGTSVVKHHKWNQKRQEGWGTKSQPTNIALAR